MNNSNESEDILLTFLNEHIHKPLESQQDQKLERIKEEIDASIGENPDIKDMLEKVIEVSEQQESFDASISETKKVLKKFSDSLGHSNSSIKKKVENVEDILNNLTDSVSKIPTNQQVLIKLHEDQKTLIKEKTEELGQLLNEVNSQSSKIPDLVDGISQTQNDLKSNEEESIKRDEHVSDAIGGIAVTLNTLSNVDQNINQLKEVSSNINTNAELIPDVKRYSEEIKKELLKEIKSNNQEIIKLSSEQNDRLQETITRNISMMNKKLIYLSSAFAIQLVVTVGYIIYLTI